MQSRERILILITGTLQTRLALTQQLQEIIGDLIEIQSYSLEEGIPCVFHNRFIILSTPLIEDETKEYIGSNCEVITGNRTVNYQNIDKLWLIPQGTPILYVNDYRETAVEAIQSLIHLGIDQLEYIPYYPGKQGTPKIPLAVTPGEVDLVPEFVSEVIDLGPRLFDITSIMSILQKLELLEQRGIEISEKYTRKIIDLSKNLAQASQAVNRINGHLYHVLNGVHHGILSVDEHGYITVLNENLGDLLRVNALRAIGRNVRSILPESIVSYILSDHEEGQAYFTIHQTDVVVQRFRIEHDQSIVATFKVRETLNWDQRVRKELVQKGYIAKYHFSDIIGNSSTIQETKRIAAKIAQTDLTVLIQGESGTGKELFASAIHNDSRRATGPFLAVNFSALPEDLVESELFGYEEGAFTGAKKGGKPGLFEQAQGGTIFLDEIGDISLKIQARLLRVLQEKEIMRVGGSKIIPVDVRVIAATNKDLLSMIEQGKFREDLYHRLKVLYLHLPSLRARDQDIELLIHHFIQTTEFMNITILPEVIHYLGQYPWYGNVRELKHTLEYMLAVCEQDVMTLRDLPAEGFFQRGPMKPAVVDYNTVSPYEAELSADEEVLLSILSTIQALNHAGQAAGRKKIADESGNWRHQLSEQQIRHRMNTLEERGWIVKSKGRSGTKLTQAGIDYLRTQKKGVH